MSAPPADEAIRRRGFLLVLSSPSGAGKTTITRRLIERDATLSLSVSVTTRPPRPGETDGRDYRFIDQARFDAKAPDQVPNRAAHVQKMIQACEALIGSG